MHVVSRADYLSSHVCVYVFVYAYLPCMQKVFYLPLLSLNILKLMYGNMSVYMWMYSCVWVYVNAPINLSYLGNRFGISLILVMVRIAAVSKYRHKSQHILMIKIYSRVCICYAVYVRTYLVAEHIMDGSIDKAY